MWRIASKKMNGGRDICLEIDMEQGMFCDVNDYWYSPILFDDVT